MAQRIFVTGGAGFIGSHTVLALLRARYDVHVFDNFHNSSPRALRRVTELTGAPIGTTEGDVRSMRDLSAAVDAFRPDAAIHFAGLKAVGESEAEPLEYYTTNVQGTVNLLRAMDKQGSRRMVFSSSATVYGTPSYLPFDEAHPINPSNTYGRTKAMAETVIRDWCHANGDAGAMLLRYFNPVGADESGRIGEDPTGRPDNLMPFIAQVAVGRRQKLSVFGDDYDTRDGTGERDYIHVSDLARAHVAAVERVLERPGCDSCNVGTGQGVTVMEMIRAFERASNRRVPYKVVDRRAGDLGSYYASTERARDVLGWSPEMDLHEMCASTWNWQQQNPNGYRDG
ncbi:UDP-glucose 4-epimerase [Rhodobacteraceae bacterium THAF1]|uniref:UDP-glucose 4-epimerase GalE n=1 Tax=Palleronia sp. THAF1 TaxID=2587842 RepID=UPI000F402502|nr:UDP-glucose 4-epimerase GalE [Palleronia sp. THAF1]QFU09213.1 UDP-glucose 4-epimerase [Palleronia sp. THAF1]VDC27335.1 UDP-glucose 4-epimerase [Rhodobacteraceae bacterium THAF1]